jgi:hypothetical protein
MVVKMSFVVLWVVRVVVTDASKEHSWYQNQEDHNHLKTQCDFVHAGKYIYSLLHSAIG